MKHTINSFTIKLSRALKFSFRAFRTEPSHCTAEQGSCFSWIWSFCAFKSYPAFQAGSSSGFILSNYFCMILEFTSLARGFSLAHWNARATHEVQWMLLVMEMCCVRYGAWQHWFSSGSLWQLELVFPTVPLERGWGSMFFTVLWQLKLSTNYNCTHKTLLDFQSSTWKLSCELFRLWGLVCLLSIFVTALSTIRILSSKVLYRIPPSLRFSAVISLRFLGSWDLESCKLDTRCRKNALFASRIFVTSILKCILNFWGKKNRTTVNRKMSHFLSLNLHELMVKCWSLSLQFLNHKICLFHPIKERFNLYGYLSLKAIREVGGERRRSLNQ